MIPSPRVMITSSPYRSARWPACQGVPPLRVSAITGPEQLDPDQQRGDRGRGADGQVDDREDDPEHLGDGDRPDVRERGAPPGRVVTGGAEPEEHHRDPHDDVPGDHHAVVEDVALLDRRERLLQAEREDDHADHLHHRRQADHPVVGVVGGREPRVVDPGPRDRERRERRTRRRPSGRAPRRARARARSRRSRTRRRTSGRRGARAASPRGDAPTGRGRTSACGGARGRSWPRPACPEMLPRLRSRPSAVCAIEGPRARTLDRRDSGARRTRTADLLGAIQALSQLSYSPAEGEV